MKLIWSAFALADRDGIFTHIEADNPAAAASVDERIAAAARRLRDFPESGRPGRIAGTRELVITGTPYIAAYVVTETAVRILRVLHGAQQWPEALPED
ncbi:type II toxin-antitoxin system RelE/ParE family toxin (plasmid) [Rhizobium sp. CB3171]|uniref:type II toxin-antitoxin system RelE/ParE family toxin n=1 Tax=unclassified Rhizobium TaxID=2613769 RepID=UPI000CDF3C7D|nr:MULTISPECIES: type II toxin-antitoxin system RelE/ParE family toxin [unclassified Rhizobium]AVA23827.1 toxin-antitoxin system toxin RelE/ParE family protein [Rhizobium sp. NXC24]WFU07111.1 type II toxin-antitoxin system RelE/ParE family toxin [Rhizobium sp. CB3171]